MDAICARTGTGGGGLNESSDLRVSVSNQPAQEFTSQGTDDPLADRVRSPVGAPVAAVRAAFYYVAYEQTVRTADLLDEAGLAALIEQVPAET
jgi:hypothetical protein